jgi:lipoprotein-anchoring transpeptidase ErfK/SrfK
MWRNAVFKGTGPKLHGLFDLIEHLGGHEAVSVTAGPHKAELRIPASYRQGSGSVIGRFASDNSKGTAAMPDPTTPTDVSRRLFVAGLPLLLAGCQSSRMRTLPTIAVNPFGRPADPRAQEMYAALPDEPFPVPAMNIARVDPRWLRQEVDYDGDERAGTIVVNPDERHLYLVRENGTALRYGVGVGREGFGWTGRAVVKRKAVWPTWTPPAEMVARDPLAREWAGGMPGGPQNPLGARALYLYQGDRDTLYRLHGTSDPSSIGTAVSSGCVRLFNHDIIDLHRRVPVGTAVRVLPSASV